MTLTFDRVGMTGSTGVRWPAEEDRFDLRTAVLGAQRGDQTAFGRLVRHHERLVRSTVRRFRLDPATVDDVVQNTWLRVLTRIDSLRNPDAFAGWVAAIARNEAISVIRRRDRERPDDIAPERLVFDTDHCAALIKGEELDALRGAVGRLPEATRRLLGLLFAEEPIPYEEVAEAVGRPQGSIGPTRRRCLARLEAMLEGTAAAVT